MLVHRKAIIKNSKNIVTKGLLQIGINYVGFTHKKDVTFLNIQGKFINHANVSIERGCRIDVGKNAIVEIGENSYLNPFTKMIIQHGLSIGKNCAISWDCHFLDDDFHQLKYEEKKDANENNIIIGDKVWIGSNVAVYKGVKIGNGSVIAANSVVKNRFDEENVLIAGNPARIIKRNINWIK